MERKEIDAKKEDVVDKKKNYAKMKGDAESKAVVKRSCSPRQDLPISSPSQSLRLELLCMTRAGLTTSKRFCTPPINP